MVYHPRRALYIGTTHRHNISVNMLYALTYICICCIATLDTSSIRNLYTKQNRMILLHYTKHLLHSPAGSVRIVLDTSDMLLHPNELQATTV